MTGAADGRSLVVVPATEEPKVVRIDTLTKEVGWLLVTAGVVGLIMPGIPGTPFLVIGFLVVTPGGSKLLSRWAGGDKPPGFIKGAMKPIGRFLEDLERRYPRNAPKP
jgi:hypothetical protein